MFIVHVFGVSDLPRASDSTEDFRYNQRQNDGLLQKLLCILQISNVIPAIQTGLKVKRWRIALYKKNPS